MAVKIFHFPRIFRNGSHFCWKTFEISKYVEKFSFIFTFSLFEQEMEFEKISNFQKWPLEFKKFSFFFKMEAIFVCEFSSFPNLTIFLNPFTLCNFFS
jgi:hypothetical protein